MAKANNKDRDDLIGVRLRLPKHIDRKLETECVKLDVTKQAYMQEAIIYRLRRSSCDSSMGSSDQ